MENDNPQNPTPAPEGTPTPPAQNPATVEEMIPRKQYTGLQSQFNRRNQEYQQLQADYDTINTGKTQAEQLAQQRFDALTAANTRIWPWIPSFSPSSVSIRRSKPSARSSRTRT